VSSNAGNSWNQINSGLGSLNVTSLTSDGINIYAGTSDEGVFISNDLGLNWTAINNGLNTNDISYLYSDSTLIFAGTSNNGLFISDNQGTSWNQASNGISNQSDIRCIYHYDTLLFATTGNGEVFSSLNYGDTWIEITNDLTGAPIYSLTVFNDYLYAGINAGGVWKMPLSMITGIVDKSNESNINIYPNPTKNILTIETREFYNDSYIMIYSLSGQKIRTQQIHDKKTTIDISAIKPGVYFVKYGSQSLTRFIKE